MVNTRNWTDGKIQTGLGVGKSDFVAINDAVYNGLERAGLLGARLQTKQHRVAVETMLERIATTFPGLKGALKPEKLIYLLALAQKFNRYDRRRRLDNNRRARRMPDESSEEEHGTRTVTIRKAGLEGCMMRVRPADTAERAGCWRLQDFVCNQQAVEITAEDVDLKLFMQRLRARAFIRTGQDELTYRLADGGVMTVGDEVDWRGALEDARRNNLETLSFGVRETSPRVEMNASRPLSARNEVGLVQAV